MIDLQHEKLLTFDEVRKLQGVLPRRRQGKQLDISTLYRWWKSGLAGVHLEVLSIGGSPATSIQALNRFFVSVAQAKQQRAAQVTARRAAADARAKDRRRQLRSRTQRRDTLQRELLNAGLMRDPA